MPDWVLTVIQCPNGSGILLSGVQCWAGGVLYGTTDGSGQVTLANVLTYSLFKTSYQVGTWAHPGSAGAGSTCLILSGGGGGGGGTEPGAPADPSGLVAVPLSDTEIELSWSDNSADEDGFAVERSDDGVLGWTEIDTVPADTTVYVDSGLTPGTTYYYRVRARSGIGDSGASNVANATTTGGAMAGPAAPSDLTATAVSASRIRLEWRDNSDDETGFKIERSADGLAGWVEVGRVEDNLLTFFNTGLAAETAYYYRVRAYSAGGNSAYTNVAGATTLAAGEGECAVTPYATVRDVQARVWSDVWAATDAGQPDRAMVEDWLCQVSHWMDAQLRWRYEVPITDAGDREILRPVCGGLVAALVWDVLITRNPGQEQRAGELRAASLSHFVWHPGGVGTFMKGGSAVLVGRDTSQMGRSYLVLPNSPESATGESERGQPIHSFTKEPGVGTEPARFFRRDRLF